MSLAQLVLASILLQSVFHIVEPVPSDVKKKNFLTTPQEIEDFHVKQNSLIRLNYQMES